MNPFIGKSLGGYQVLEQIGQGGMATIYKAYQPSMDRYVAIKVLPSHFTEDETFVARFTQEARTLARLEHPHILPVYDYGEQEGVTYLVMRYVDAGTLKDLIAQRGPLSLNETVRLLSQVGRALGHAHSQGVVHRDIKPTNVLIQHENAFLTDFGIAKLVAGTAQFTATGAVVGTPAYMSPEQGLGETVDHRCDIYALGVVLYEMAVGRVPYEAETPLAVLLKHVNEPLPPPRQIKSDLPQAVERVILKAMAKSPDDRFQSAEALVDALQSVLTQTPTEVPVAPPVTPAESAAPSAAPTFPPPSPQRKRRVWPFVALGFAVPAAIALIAVLVIFALSRDKRKEQPVVRKSTATSRPTATARPTDTPMSEEQPTLMPTPTAVPQPTATLLPDPTQPPAPTPEPPTPVAVSTTTMRHFEGSGFAVDYPEQWEESSLDAMGLTIAIFTTRQLTMEELNTVDFDELAATDPVVIVMVVPPELVSDMGLQDFDSALAEFDDIVPEDDADIIQQGDTTIGGMPGKIIVARGNDPDIGEMGVHMVVAKLLDGTVVLLMGVTPDQNLDVNLDIFAQMHDTMSFGDVAVLPTPVAPVAMQLFQGSAFGIEYPEQWQESSLDAFGMTMGIFSTRALGIEELDSLDFEDMVSQDPVVIAMVVPPEMVGDMGFGDIDSTMDEFDDILPGDDAEIIQQGEATLGGIEGRIVVATGHDPDMGEIGVHLFVAEKDDGTAILFMGATPVQDLDLNMEVFQYMFNSFQFVD